MILLTSCSSYFSRSFTEGYVYYYKSKKPVENAKVFIKNNNEYIFETNTNLKGYFSFNAKKHTKLGYDTRDLATKFIIKKDNSISDTLDSYGGNDITKFDSIFINPIKK
jgi:hypothetical protein